MRDAALPIFPVTHESDETRDIERSRAGDPEAFRRLYEYHVPHVHRVARWLLAAGEVDDAVQEVFVRAWTKLELFDGRASFKTWLCRLAVNVILRGRQREAKRRMSRLDDVAEPIAPTLGRGAATFDLERGVDCLPAGAREVFVLFDVQGFSHREVARALGISVRTSRSQLHRARTLLRRHLGSGEETA